MTTEPEVKHGGQCMGCGKWVTASTAREWKKVVKAPCPHCGRKGW